MAQTSVEIQRMTLNKFCLAIEEVINDLVASSKALRWDENYITAELFARITTRLNGSLISDLDDKVVFLTPFKLGLSSEKKFGDIAIIVNIDYGDGDSIEGVAFLEAKKKYKASRNFDALKWEQLNRIYNNAPHSQLLLYDFRDISEFASTGLVSKKSGNATNPMIQLPVTKFVTVPLTKAIQVKKKNDRLYKLSLPLSYQIGYRYMNGFDLDFQHDILKEVKTDFENNFENIDSEMPNYLIYVSVVPNEKVEEVEDTDSKKRRGQIPNTGINSDLYNKIEPSE